MMSQKTGGSVADEENDYPRVIEKIGDSPARYEWEEE